MAEGMTDDELVGIVDSYKRNRLTRTPTQTTEDHYNRLVTKLFSLCGSFHSLPLSLSQSFRKPECQYGAYQVHWIRHGLYASGSVLSIPVYS